jgi:hypothetical protein
MTLVAKFIGDSPLKMLVAFSKSITPQN